MAKVKEISVGAKKSWSYQTFEASEVILIEDGDDVDLVRKEAQARVRRAVVEQIEIEKIKGQVK